MYNKILFEIKRKSDDGAYKYSEYNSKYSYGVHQISFVKKVGDTSGAIGSSSDRAGFVIAQADDAEEAIGICEKVCDVVKIRIK